MLSELHEVRVWSGVDAGGIHNINLNNDQGQIKYRSTTEKINGFVVFMLVP